MKAEEQSNYMKMRDLADEEWLKKPKKEILQLYKNCYDMLMQFVKAKEPSDLAKDKAIIDKIKEIKMRAEKIQKEWNFPNEHYIEATGAIMVCDELLEFQGKTFNRPDNQKAIIDKQAELIKDLLRGYITPLSQTANRLKSEISELQNNK